MWWSDFWRGPWMFFGPLTMLVFAAVCAALIYLAMRGVMSGRQGAGRALEILKERYARGEIDQAEFEERRRLLT